MLDEPTPGAALGYQAAARGLRCTEIIHRQLQRGRQPAKFTQARERKTRNKTT